MSHMMRTSMTRRNNHAGDRMRNCPIPYVKTYDPTALNQVKLQADFEDNIKRSTYVNKFDGTSIEMLIDCKMSFDRACDYLYLTEAEEFYEYYPLTLESIAHSTWNTILAQQTDADGNNITHETEDDFDRDVNSLKLKFTSPTARTDQFRAMTDWQKPFGVDGRPHWNRMTEVIDRHNQLPGTKYDIPPEEVNETIFKTFRKDWQTEFLKCRGSGDDFVEADVVDFMEKKRLETNPPNGRNNFGRPRNNRGHMPYGNTYGGRGFGRGVFHRGGFGRGGRGFGGARQNFNFQARGYQNGRGFHQNGGGRFQQGNRNYYNGRSDAQLVNPAGRFPYARGANGRGHNYTARGPQNYFHDGQMAQEQMNSQQGEVHHFDNVGMNPHMQYNNASPHQPAHESHFTGNQDVYFQNANHQGGAFGSDEYGDY